MVALSRATVPLGTGDRSVTHTAAAAIEPSST